MSRQVIAAILMASCSISPLSASPALAEEESTMSTGMTGIFAGVSSMAYTPLKIAYAGGGIVVGALSFVVSGGDAMPIRRVTRAAVRGDYVVTPTHLRGDRDLVFIGE